MLYSAFPNKSHIRRYYRVGSQYHRHYTDDGSSYLCQIRGATEGTATQGSATPTASWPSRETCSPLQPTVNWSSTRCRYKLRLSG
jgi:hypothetical protein